MKKLYFKYGVMGSSKSAMALMTAFNYRQKGFNVILMKPSLDTREADNVIKSRIGLSYPCLMFSKEENLVSLVEKYAGVQIVIVDEAQFCTKEQIDQLKKLTMNDITVLCYGLKTNFKGELFEGSKRLFELCESLQEIKHICRCGKKATMNARIINGYVTMTGEEIQIGGDEIYESMCFECFEKYKKEKLPKLN